MFNSDAWLIRGVVCALWLGFVEGIVGDNFAVYCGKISNLKSEDIPGFCGRLPFKVTHTGNVHIDATLVEINHLRFHKKPLLFFLRRLLDQMIRIMTQDTPTVRVTFQAN